MREDDERTTKRTTKSGMKREIRAEFGFGRS
jgi:hypothetical protein